MLGYHGYYTYYIHWASKFATSANKRADKRIYKTESTSEGTRLGKLGPRKQPNKLMRPQLF